MAKAKEPHPLSANPLPDVTDRLKEGRLVRVHMELFPAKSVERQLSVGGIP